MCDLIDHHWLVAHMDRCGDYPLDWNDEQKDEAANQALHECKNAERLVSCFVDFFANKGCEPLYLVGLAPFQQAEVVRNNIWACLESAIVEQCASIVETRGWKE